MEDWLAFEGCIVPMEWGDSVYTVLPLPVEIYEDLKAQNAKRVEVELNDVPFNMALTKAPMIDQVFVYAGKSVLAEANIDPGEVIDVRVRKADPNLVDVPQDVTLAIVQNGVSGVWDAMTAGKKRGCLHLITQAKRPQTRAARISKLIEQLKAL